MKIKLKILLIALAMIPPAIESFSATSASYIISLTQSNQDDNTTFRPGKGNRLPFQRIDGTISVSKGVVIPNFTPKK